MNLAIKAWVLRTWITDQEKASMLASWLWMTWGASFYFSPLNVSILNLTVEWLKSLVKRGLVAKRLKYLSLINFIVLTFIFNHCLKLPSYSFLKKKLRYCSVSLLLYLLVVRWWDNICGFSLLFCHRSCHFWMQRIWAALLYSLFFHISCCMISYFPESQYFNFPSFLFSL